MIKITQGKPFAFDENSELFFFLNPCGNDSISNMPQDKLVMFFSYLKNYLLSLREHLNFDDFFTFGLELEFENADVPRIRYNFHRYYFIENWELDFDDRDLGVMEVRSAVLLNSLADWLALHKVATNISKNAIVGTHSGGHIHIGSQVLGNDPIVWYYFGLFWNAYEHIIFRHCYGERKHARPNIINYAKTMKNTFERVIYYWQKSAGDDLSYILSILEKDRYQAVNFQNVYLEKLSSYNFNNTIEFRNPNGTLNPVIWQNNVNLFVHILRYVRSEKFDLEKVMWRKEQSKFLSLSHYENLFLEDALEFCDMIFSTNLDKIYFLRQYLKNDFEISQRIKTNKQ